MDNLTIIKETAKYLFEYRRTFNPENEIILFIKKRGDLLLAYRIEDRAKQIYAKESGLFFSRDLLFPGEIESLLSLISENEIAYFCFCFSKKLNNPSLYNFITL